MALVLGGLMLMVGVAFKLSAVPFHFWCPDVFEGASAEVNAFLSVASKGAAIALLLRLVIGFGHVEPSADATMTALAPAVQTVATRHRRRRHPAASARRRQRWLRYDVSCRS
jgi:NADH-quinone oxidoreductase subunit N